MNEPVLPERFTILRCLSSDEAEVLLSARDRLLLREVLLKCPGPGLAAAFKDRELRETMLREARALARIQHPGVIRLIDVIESETGPILVIEPVQGETLAERLAREGPLEAQEVRRIGAQVAQALEVVHAGGLVHRGLSTASIVLGPDDRPTLTGFHFAKPGGTVLETMTMTSILYSGAADGPGGALPTHPAPEQFCGLPADARSDLFSLGWVLFESLTGERPFEDALPIAWVEPRDARRLVPGAPKDLVRAIQRCLAIDPLRRFPDARELAAALQPSVPVDGGEAAVARPAPASRRTTLAAGVGAVAVLVALGIWFLLPGRSARGEVTIPLASDVSRGVMTIDAPGQERFLPLYEKSHAFLIGIGSAYDATSFNVLPNAERDAQALADVLEERGGWDVQTMIGNEATRVGVIRAMTELADRAAEDDRVFIYYAGHGEPHPLSPGSAWIIPADADPDDRASMVRFDEFFRFFEETRAKHVLIAMDCCYAGRLTAARSSVKKAFEENYLTERAHVVIASGRADELVTDGFPGEHSPFAEAILQALERDEPVTSSMLFAHTLESFATWNVGHRPQMGWPEGASTGEFVFFPRGEGTLDETRR